MSKRRMGMLILDVVLIVLALTMAAAATCWFLAGAQPDQSRYKTAQSDTVSARLMTATLIGGTVTIPAPELNHYIQNMFSTAPQNEADGLVSLKTDTEAAENAVTLCAQLRQNNRMWTFTASGILEAVQTDGAVTAIAFRPQQVYVGRLPIPKWVWEKYMSDVARNTDQLTVQNGVCTFSLPELPVTITGVKVMPEGVQITVRSVFSGSGDNNQPDNDQPDNDQPDNNQPDNDQPDNNQSENNQPDNEQPGDSELLRRQMDAFLTEARQRLADGRVTLYALMLEWKQQFPEKDVMELLDRLQDGLSEQVESISGTASAWGAQLSEWLQAFSASSGT